MKCEDHPVCFAELVDSFGDGDGNLTSFQLRSGFWISPATGSKISVSADGFLDDGRFLTDLFSADGVDGMVGRDAVGPGEESSRWVKRIETSVDLDEYILGCVEGVFPVSQHPDQHGKNPLAVTTIELLEAVDISGEVTANQATVFIVLLHIHETPS